MYAFEEMIDLGLLYGQSFPTQAHRDVAVVLAVGNPHVMSRDHLTEIVQAVIAVPRREIKKVTVMDLRKRGVRV